NHDVWGWTKSKSRTTGDEALYGKKWAAETLRLGPRPYRSFDRAGWHFVFLDSIFPSQDGYIGRLDNEQHEWLTADLASVAPATPILVVSHIPILSVAVLYFDGNDERKANQVDPSLLHIDAGRLHNLFLRHNAGARGAGGGVRACISGHLHLIDRCEYDGV